MGHSLASVHVHFIFSTKKRLAYLEGDLQADMFAYLGGIVRELGGKAVIIGGMPEHVHMLVRMPPGASISDFMRVVKANSSKWAKSRRRDFAWQTGFAAFSVSMSVLPQVTRYIQEQEKHHKRITFPGGIGSVVEEAQHRLRPAAHLELISFAPSGPGVLRPRYPRLAPWAANSGAASRLGA